MGTRCKFPVEHGRRLRVLVVRIGAMGDVLHALPAVSALRAAHPEWTIEWAVEPGWRELLQAESASSAVRDADSMPVVDGCVAVRAREWKRRPLAPATGMDIAWLRRRLREGRYDLAVDMQGTIRSAVVGRLAGAGELVGYDAPRERPAAWLYGRRVRVSAEHVVEQGCELLGAAVGEELHPARVALPVDGAAERWCDETMGLAGSGPFVLIVPTAGWGAKQWPAERFGAVARELAKAGYRTLVNASSGSSQNNAAAEAVVKASGGSASTVVSSLGQLIALTRRAALVIGGDTGPVHLAAALERPVVGLYGPTDPARNGPYGASVRVLRHASSRTDHTRRSETEAGLMRIGAEEVAEAALEQLRAGQDKVDL